MNQLRASDLRLGNLVLFRGKICKVTTLSGDIIRVSEPAVGIVEQAYPKSPIELTPEVLGWCGFQLNSTEKTTTQWSDEESITQYFAYKDSFVIKYRPAASYKFTYGKINMNIQYLHQLQNLYYSLTGEELTISLTTVKLEEK